MRKLAVALVALIVAGLGVVVPATAAPVRAASAGPKVAIIVGATGSVTSTYRAYADQIYATATQYTSNVVRVYSPDATWPRVTAAVNGASIIVYLGHGNGWPSPYGNDAAYTTKDSFGLNYDANGDGVTTDSELKYYGEPSIRTLKPAPNAVVLLFHLCYASGNSEPGKPDPTLAVAQQRADNYAAPFLAAGAKAVIAIGHSHDPYYISALFTANESLRDYWTGAPGAHGNVLQSASVRTPGATELLDPDDPTPAGFWRSATGDLALSTAAVTGASFADTGADPAQQPVPGNATPAPGGATLYGAPADAAAGTNPVATLPSSTIVRVVATTGVTTAGGSPVYAVRLDSGATGFMAGASLIPRDSVPPSLRSTSDGGGVLSPDGNGANDALPISLQLSETASWTITITDIGGAIMASSAGTSSVAALTWAPAPHSVPDGRYHWNLTATDAYGNGPLIAHGDITVDATAPTLGVSGGPGRFVLSPNGDGVSDVVAMVSSEAGSVRATVLSAAGAMVAQISGSAAGRPATLSWGGTAVGGLPVPDGTYTLTATATDLAGNSSPSVTRQVIVDRTLGFVASSRSVIFPQGGDPAASATVLSYRLAGAATVSWSVVNSKGAAVRTIAAGTAQSAGTYTFSWDGRDDTGALVPQGVYRSQVVANDAVATVTQQAPVTVGAFLVTASAAAPGRGQRITVTASAAVGLKAAPRLVVSQPGARPWSVAMAKVAAGVYRATVTLRSSSAGTLRLKVTGAAANGTAQQGSLSLPLR